MSTWKSFSIWIRNLLKRQVDSEPSVEGDAKRVRLDNDISEETVATILAVINDPKKMLGPEVSHKISYV
jgi:hypothetical protein